MPDGNAGFIRQKQRPCFITDMRLIRPAGQLLSLLVTGALRPIVDRSRENAAQSFSVNDDLRWWPSADLATPRSST